MRKIFSLLMAAVLSISTAFATTVYCKVTQGWWTADGAAVGVHYWCVTSAGTAWPGVRMTPVSGAEGVWSYDVPEDVTGLIFTRVNGSGDIIDWGAKTTDLSLPTDGKNLYTITSESAVWGDPGATGEWSVYGEEPTPVDPPTPVDSMTVYVVNTLDWTTVNAFVWPADGNAYKAWPGEAMTPVNTQINGKDVYAYTFPASFVNIIFNNGTDQTIDLTWAEATPYFVLSEKNAQNKYEGAWYAKENIPAPVDPSEDKIIYDWAGNIGTTILNGAETSKVKIHTNTDEISGIKFSASANRLAIKPAEGAFKAGDSIFLAVCFNNSDDTKQAQIRVYAADGTTQLFESAQGVNGRTSAEDPSAQVFVLEAAQDSILFARQGNTATYITLLQAIRPSATPVPPVAATFYVTGDSALVTDAGFAGKAWNPDAIKAEADTLVLNLKAEQVYKLKVSLDGTWSTAKGFNELTEKPEGVTTDNDENIIFSLAEAGAVQVIYIAGETPIFKIAGNFYVEPTPEPELTNGYYLVGKFSGVDAWSVEDLSAEKLFAANQGSEGEYQLSINLAIGDEVKVVYVENDAIVTWYPAEGENYVIDDHHNGATTMYFRPDYQGGEDWFAGCIYVVPTSTVGFENTAADTKAVKVLKNGILVIEKNNKTYNVMGQMVK